MKTYATRECTAHADVHYPIKNTNHVTTAVTARYATRECAAHADVHYPIKNTNHVTTAVTAQKHGRMNNSRNNNNSEGVHTQHMGLFVRRNRDHSAIA